MLKYTDLNTSFDTENPGSKSTVTDVEVIKNSLLRLLSTSKGEVPYNRTYGTTLKTLLFENNLNAADVANFLYMDITTWEPRVTLTPADITVSQIDANTYQVICSFTIPSLNNATSSITSTISKG